MVKSSSSCVLSGCTTWTHTHAAWPVHMLFTYTSWATQHCSDTALHSLFRTGKLAFWLASCITSFFLMHLTCRVIRQHAESKSLLILLRHFFYDTSLMSMKGPLISVEFSGSYLQKYVRQPSYLHSYCWCKVWKVPCSFSTWHSVYLWSYHGTAMASKLRIKAVHN